MPERVVYFNGEYVPESEARISIFDSALMFGDMAFEMTRTFGGRIFRLRAHLERLYASLKLMEIDCGLTIDEMEEATRETLARNVGTEPDDCDWQIMHDVSRGPLPFYASTFPATPGPTVSINCWPLYMHMGLEAPNYETGVDLAIVSQRAIPADLLDPKAKTRSRLHYQMANLQAARIGHGVRAVLLDPDGYLTEGTGSNVLLVRDGVIYSPEPRNMLLGVARAVTIELARELGIEVRETNLDRYSALQADEIFCTGTSFCLMYASSFEGQPVGDGGPGPVYRRLLDAWKAHVGLDFVAQARDYATRYEAWHEAQSAASRDRAASGSTIE